MLSFNDMAEKTENRKKCLIKLVHWSNKRRHIFKPITSLGYPVAKGKAYYQQTGQSQPGDNITAVKKRPALSGVG